MLKKIAMIGVLGTLGAGAVVGTGAWSYVRTGLHTAHQSVRDSVPIDWEIKRAREMIGDLKPEIQRNAEIVAREEVAVKRLEQEIDGKESLLAKGRDDIMRLKNDLQSGSDSGSVHFTYAGRKYSESQVREDLSNRFKQFQVHEQTTSKLRQVLTARERNLDAARRKLDGMLAAKRELEVEIENLQARMTLVEVAQTNSPVALDDSQLSGTRRLLDEIATRIDVAERMVASEGILEGAIELDETHSPELIDEITDYFGEGRADVESLVSKSNQ